MAHNMNRRKFIRNTGLAGLSVALSLENIQALSFQKNNKVRIGLIGVGLRGQEHVRLMAARQDVMKDMKR